MSSATFRPSHPMPGMVYLVGAGPGDPELITVRGLRRLAQADVVLYDRLTHPALLDEAPREAQRIFVGKAPGRPGPGQAEIHRLLIEHARRGLVVVRLKGGDPFVFGRGGEEAAALTEAGVPFEVVPAVSSAFGVPATAGIPLTHRGLARSFAVITAHRADDGDHEWAALAKMDTLVVLMGVSALPRIARRLVRNGRPPETPVAVVSRGTLPDEQVVIGTLRDIAERAALACVRAPATVVVGEVVGLRDSLLGPEVYVGGVPLTALVPAASDYRSHSHSLHPVLEPATPQGGADPNFRSPNQGA